MSNLLLAELYLRVKEILLEMGYDWEIDWQYEASLKINSESQILSEGAWAVLSAGMRESVVRKIFPHFSNCFFDWISAKQIIDNESFCRGEALTRFRSPWKIEAILRICRTVGDIGAIRFIEELANKGQRYLVEAIELGPVTSIHFMKNLGVDVVKPDRHLCRIAALFDCADSIQLGNIISSVTGEKLAVIDVVFWRFATVFSDYENILKSWASGTWVPGKEFKLLPKVA